MNRPRTVRALGVAALLAVAVHGAAGQATLKIVVLEGEGAINIIQQNTATAPVVEVRDQNDLPVAGVSVTFSIGGSGASFGGSSTLTIVTNTAGRAVATGLTPTVSGSLQIGVSAVFQGQTAVATIAQMNVLTAAQAAGASAAAAGSGGAAGGGGGGLSTTTLGLVGAGVAGGVVAAKALDGEKLPATVSGTYSGQTVHTVRDSTGILCQRTEMFSGTVTLNLQQQDSSVTGTADVVLTHEFLGGTCGPFNTSTGQQRSVPVTGSPDNLSFNRVSTSTAALTGGASVQNSRTLAFTGMFSGGQITGTLRITDHSDFSSGAVGDGSVVSPITFR